MLKILIPSQSIQLPAIMFQQLPLVFLKMLIIIEKTQHPLPQPYMINMVIKKSNSTINGTFLNLSKISGYGSSNGTVYACGPTGNGVAANYGDGCSNPIDLSTISIDFNGTSTQTIYDLSYDVGNVIEIRFDNGSGVTTQSSPAAVAQDISWNTVTGTVGSYTFVNPAGPITSGVSANWTITALDRAA